MTRIILPLFLAVFILSGCQKGNGSREIIFSPVKEGDAMSSEPVIIKAKDGIKEAEQALAPDTSGAGYEPPSVKAAQFDLPNGPILAIRTEGSDWCGTMGCNTDFYLKEGTYKAIGSVSFNLPAYSLSCDKKGYVLMNAPGENYYRVWHLSGLLLQLIEPTIPLDSKTPCQLLAGL